MTDLQKRLKNDRPLSEQPRRREVYPQRDPFAEYRQRKVGSSFVQRGIPHISDKGNWRNKNVRFEKSKVHARTMGG